MNEQYTSDNRHFYREIPDYSFGGQRAYISKNENADDTAIRLYCEAYNQAWGLQIRGFYQTKNYKKGKQVYLAHVTLTEDDLRQLRDACNAALADLDGD